MSDKEDNVTTKISQAIQRWANSTERVDAAGREARSADTQLCNETDALGRLLSPSDSKKGDVFSIWHGSQLLQVTVEDLSGNGTYKIEYRAKGKKYA